MKTAYVTATTINEKCYISILKGNKKINYSLNTVNSFLILFSLFINLWRAK